MRYIIRSQDGVLGIAQKLARLPVPFTVEVYEGEPRRDAQNSLAFRWYQEIGRAKFKGDTEEARGYCKLHFGVAIVKNGSEAYAAQYDELIKPMPYEAKMRLMKAPIDFPVTRVMTVKKMIQYLEQMQRHWIGEGVALTDPENLKYQNQELT